MSHDTLTPVSRGDEYMEVHPTALANHKELGWSECERREVVADPRPKTKKAAAEAADDATTNKAGE